LHGFPVFVPVFSSFFGYKHLYINYKPPSSLPFHGFSMVFPWFFHGFSMVFPRFFHGFSTVFPTAFLNIHRWRLIHRPLPQRPLQQLQGQAPAVAGRSCDAGGDGGAVKDDVGRKLGGGLEEEPGRNVILVDLPIKNSEFTH
jgi:hypothetical protein